CWENLDQSQREFASDVSILRSSFGIHSVESVVENKAGLDVGAMLQQLVDLGLIEEVATGAASNIRRFKLNHTLRVFVHSRLDDAQRELLWVRYAEFLFSKCEKWADEVHGRDGTEVMARIALDWDHLLAVVQHGFKKDPLESVWVDRGIRSLLVLNSILEARGPFSIQETLLDQALKACDALLGTDPLLHARALIARAEVRLGRGQYDQAIAELERAFNITRRWSDDEGGARCNVALARTYIDKKDFSSAERHLASALGFYAATGLRRLEGIALATQAISCQRQGKCGAAVKHFNDSLAILEEVNALHQLGKYKGCLGTALSQLGRKEDARAALRESIRLNRLTGDRRREGAMLGRLGELDYHLGHLAEAAILFEDALLLAEEVGDLVSAAAALTSLALVRMELGQFDEAKQLMVRSLALGQGGAGRQKDGLILGYLGVLHHRAGRVRGARNYYGEAIAVLEQRQDHQHRALFLGWFSSLEAEQGDYRKAEQLARMAEATIESHQNPRIRDTLEVLRWVPDLAFALTDEDMVDVCTSVEERLSKFPQAKNGDLRLALSWARHLLDSGRHQAETT
ncbi:MAG: tetratricopeptide repeat protein, partial [Proteobacteria bacterium]|nr:tetratricopeptide repeat protein [Pseudomonadota bacterium]